jgi:hypothetical protein
MLGYLAAAYALMLLLAFWVPGNDFDSMTSYITRIKLEQLGPLRETATLEVQYIFPKSFDYLHAPFLRWGYFTVFPSFALFHVLLAILALGFRPRIALAALYLVGICQPILVGATALKNDLALGVFALVAWWLIFYLPKSPFYMAACGLALATLVGTKWHGFLLAGPLGLCWLWQLGFGRKCSWAGLWVLACSLPVLWVVGSGNVYVDNLRHEGSLFPRPDFAQVWPPNFPTNLYRFAVTTALETFEVPIALADRKLRGTIWPHLQALTGGSKAWDYALLPSPLLSVFGVSILVVIAACAVSIFRRRCPRPVRAGAVIALVYLALSLAVLRHLSSQNRYFIPTYVLGVLPTAYVASELGILRVLLQRRLLRWALAAYLVVSVGHVLLFTAEKPLLSFWVYKARDRQYVRMESIFSRFWDREAFYLESWKGYRDTFDFVRSQILPSDGLLVVNRATGNDAPYLYPFIMHRSAANTRVVSDRFGYRLDPDYPDTFKYVLVYRGELEDPRYQLVHDCGGPGHSGRMVIYRRHEPTRRRQMLE